MIIDFHVHTVEYQVRTESFGKLLFQVWGENYEAALDPYRTAASFLKLMDENGVDYAVILAELAPITTGLCDNDFVAAFCAESPRLIPFASLNPYTIVRPADELVRLVAKQGFRGLKLYPTYQYFYPNESMIYPIYAAAQDLGIPVLLHIGSSVFAGSRIKYGDPLFLDDVAVDFPRLNLVMAHGGRPFWYDQAAAMARFHEGIYIELSGLPPSRLQSYFPDLERLADKVIFGSDWPGVTSIAANLNTISGLGLSEEAQRKVLGLNAARLLRL